MDGGPVVRTAAGPSQAGAEPTTTAPGGDALTTVQATIRSTPIADWADRAAAGDNCAEGGDSAGGDALPTAGSLVGLLALLGLALIGAGALLVLVLRRRRSGAGEGRGVDDLAVG